MAISPSQSSAARALLGRMSYDEVAEASGVGKYVIMRFEKNENTPHQNNLNKLQAYYESRGIEFLEHDGTRRKPATLARTLHGNEGLKTLCQEIVNSARYLDHDICITGLLDNSFLEALGEHAQPFIEEMSAVKGLSCRALLGDDIKLTHPLPFAEYRQVISGVLTGTPCIVYGAAKAELIFAEKSLSIIIIDQARCAQGFREYFSVLWQMGSELGKPCKKYKQPHVA